MGVTTFKASLSELKCDQYLRCDTDYSTLRTILSGDDAVIAKG